MNLQHNQELEKLKEEHRLEIDRVRDEEADKVMENLTAALLNMDLSGITTGAPAPQSPIVSSKKDEPYESDIEESKASQTAPEEEISLSNDPYIDTPLCTSCNECINLNGAMFNYNADKLAFIADPKAGTFKELVEAAEMCPVGIIHPGTPLHPDEPGLEELIERAEKFN